MKKIICVLFSIILTATLCSCANTNIEDTAKVTDVLPSSSIESENNESQASSIPDEESQIENVQSEPVSQESLPEKPAEPNPPQDTPPEETQPPQSDTVTVFGFTVNDPQNLRGLSNDKFAFSYGVAKDGKPHNQSINNQKKIDSYQNVSALALDTKSNEKIMYLTFDNGYEYQNLTADILNTLKEKNVKAAFFITLDYAIKNKELVKRMIDEGHIVGNHSTTHPTFPDITRTKMAEEIGELNEYLKNNFSYSSPYFRFPTGAYSENSLELVSSLGFNSVFWSVAHSDWDTSAQKGADNAFETVTSRFHPGAVILLHAVSSDNAQALGRIIDNAIENGYTFSTLDDYFNY